MHMLKMSLIREDFDNPQVAGAVNPSNYGYHYGPIPNNNPGWTPPRQLAAQQARENASDDAPPSPATPLITTEDNENPPNPAVNLSSLNSLVCDIAVNGAQMCGMICSTQPAFRRHIRQEHPGAITNRARGNVTNAERIAGENALKQWVLTCGWRNARYLNEPGRGPVHGLLNMYATVCEEIAAADSEFAKQYGTRFHRQVGSPLGKSPAPSLSKRRHGPEPPSESPSPTPKRGRGRPRGSRGGHTRTPSVLSAGSASA